MATPSSNDGLPMLEVGPWTRDKHERLRRYITICSATRRMFTGPGKAGVTYTELFSGPGRLRVREQETILPGSAAVAVAAAIESRSPFTAVHLSDLNPEAVSAAATRLRVAHPTVSVQTWTGAAAEVAPQIAARLHPEALHLVFLDPFSLNALPPAVIQAFAKLKRVDLLMHVSAMDLQRNLEQAISAEEGQHFDCFAPGWREHVDTRQAAHRVRRDLVTYWCNMVRGFGFQAFAEDQFELIRGTRKQPLYWLALAAKNPKASEFWEKIRRIEPQRGFDL
jgi:three-Cys-motif partner protein